MAWQPPFSPPYVWLLIRTLDEVEGGVERLFPEHEPARQWARRFGVGSLGALLSQAQPGIPPKLVPNAE